MVTCTNYKNYPFATTNRSSSDWEEQFVEYAKNNIYITIKSDSEISEIIIEDDGLGFSKDILTKIGEPYIKSLRSNDNKKSGLGLGIFIGKTLLEKNYAKILFRNSETRGGAEIKIEWMNNDLAEI